LTPKAIFDHPVNRASGEHNMLKVNGLF
jgi:hypothetical protein